LTPNTVLCTIANEYMILVNEQHNMVDRPCGRRERAQEGARTWKAGTDTIHRAESFDLLNAGHSTPVFSYAIGNPQSAMGSSGIPRCHHSCKAKPIKANFAAGGWVMGRA